MSTVRLHIYTSYIYVIYYIALISSRFTFEVDVECSFPVEWRGMDVDVEVPSLARVHQRGARDAVEVEV